MKVSVVVKVQPPGGVLVLDILHVQPVDELDKRSRGPGPWTGGMKTTNYQRVVFGCGGQPLKNRGQ
eukprot:7418783-Pyramimonas_sp.AAC.1